MISKPSANRAHSALVRQSECVELEPVPAGTEAEYESAAADLVDGGGLLGEDRRLVERLGGHERPDFDPR
jgi:hypothetical protein